MAERGLAPAPTVQTALVMRGLEVMEHLNPCILSIGGSDSSAGAGIQADVKTAAALGVHAASAVTCITAQNTTRFGKSQLVEPQVVQDQIDAAFEDLPIGAVKIGMLGSPEIALAVARALQHQRKGNPDLAIVVDPVLAATTDARGAREVVARAVSRHLVPLATLITPNLPEARMLANCCQQILSGSTTADNKANAAPEHAADDVIAAWAARTLIACGAKSVLVKGGHGKDPDTVTDLLFGKAADISLAVASRVLPGDGDLVPATRVFVGPGERDAYLSRPIAYSSERLQGEFHGTGCVLSTAAACGLACGLELPRAVGEARALLRRALEVPTGLGHGSKIIDPTTAM